jgi:hypothetical protein
LPERIAQMLATLMAGVRTSAPAELLDVVRRAAVPLDVQVASILPVDMEQRRLKPFPGSVTTEPQGVDATLPGRAYRTLEPVEVEGAGEWRRLFLLLLALCTALAGLVVSCLMSQSLYADVVACTRRERDMRLAAEIQWDLLPPLTMVTPTITVAGILEPCYEIAGDSFDYALNAPIVHLLLADAMGHGLDSSMVASLAIGAYRNRRRAGSGLVETYEFMDSVIKQRFGPDRFAGDAVLWFTDGVVEARSVDGGFFGEERLADLLERAIASDAPVPEVVRRLTHAVLEHQAGELQDDATMLYVEWAGAPDPSLGAA